MKEAQELKDPTEQFFAQPLDVSYLATERFGLVHYFSGIIYKFKILANSQIESKLLNANVVNVFDCVLGVSADLLEFISIVFSVARQFQGLLFLFLYVPCLFEFCIEFV